MIKTHTNTLEHRKTLDRLTRHAPEGTATFFEDCIKELAKHGVKVLISTERYFKSGDDVFNGYFEDDDGGSPVFAVAIGKPFDEWFPIFIHEFGHFTQWRDKCPEWTYIPFKDYDHIDCGSLLFMWVAGNIELTKEQATKYAIPTVMVEMDCDKRAVDLIKKYNIPLDTKHYIQTSNAYTLFYYYLVETRQWYKAGKEPYRIKDIYERMPDYFLDDYSKIDDELLAVFKEYMPNE